MMMRGLALILLLLVLSGCAASAATPEKTRIDLTALEPLPVRFNEGIVPLRVSVAAVVSPRGTAESYQPLLEYLSEALDRPVELVQRRTYQETNDLIEDGEVDVAFVRVPTSSGMTNSAWSCSSAQKSTGKTSTTRF
jgi:phosphonate transport system substrate-binding protein